MNGAAAAAFGFPDHPSFSAISSTYISGWSSMFCVYLFYSAAWLLLLLRRVRLQCHWHSAVCVCVCLWPFGHCVLYFNHVISLCATPSRTEHNTQRPKAFYLIIFHENEMLLLCIGFGMCGWRIFLLCTRAREFMPLPVSKIVMFILCCRRNESTEWNPIMGAMSRGCTALHWDALRVYAHCTHNRQTGL